MIPRRSASAAHRHPMTVLVVAAIVVAACSSSKSTTRRVTSTSTSRGAATSSTSTTTARSASDPTWPTYHHDAARTGRVTSGPGPNVKKVWSSPGLDGAIYAEPVAAAGAVIAATQNDTLYGLSADTGAIRWKTHLGEPVPRSELPCGNIDPTGITSTPVIDTTRGLVYAVAFVEPAHHELVALDLATGAVRWRTNIDPRGPDPKVEQQRSALSLDGDAIVVPFGGLFGDCGDYHGYVLTAGVDGSGIRASYMVPAAKAAAVWAPPGVVVVPGGDLLFTSGNATEATSGTDLSNSVIRLSPQLRQLGAFTPSNRKALSEADADLGSLGPSLVDGNRVFQVGKEGVGYLLDAGNLNGSTALHQAKVCSAAFGGTAYASPLLFVPCRDGLYAVRTSASRFDVAWHSDSFDAGPPVIGGATVWAVDLSSGSLIAFDVNTGRVRSRTSVGDVEHFTTPTIVGNRILVAANHRVDAYG